MANAVLKFITCPLAVILSAFLFPNVDFANWTQPVLIGIILAVAGILMEYLFLREGTLWWSTAMDFAASVAIVYIAALFLPGAYVTFWGAVLTGLILGVIEYATHVWLIQTGRAEKADID